MCRYCNRDERVWNYPDPFFDHICDYNGNLILREYYHGEETLRNVGIPEWCPMLEQE